MLSEKAMFAVYDNLVLLYGPSWSRKRSKTFFAPLKDIISDEELEYAMTEFFRQDDSSDIPPLPRNIMRHVEVLRLHKFEQRKRDNRLKEIPPPTAAEKKRGAVSATDLAPNSLPSKNDSPTILKAKALLWSRHGLEHNVSDNPFWPKTPEEREALLAEVDQHCEDHPVQRRESPAKPPHLSTMVVEPF